MFKILNQHMDSREPAWIEPLLDYRNEPWQRLLGRFFSRDGTSNNTLLGPADMRERIEREKFTYSIEPANQQIPLFAWEIFAKDNKYERIQLSGMMQ